MCTVCMISKTERNHKKVIVRIINQSHNISTLPLKLMHTNLPKNSEISQFNTTFLKMLTNFKLNTNESRFCQDNSIFFSHIFFSTTNNQLFSLFKQHKNSLFFFFLFFLCYFFLRFFIFHFYYFLFVLA